MSGKVSGTPRVSDMGFKCHPFDLWSLHYTKRVSVCPYVTVPTRTHREEARRASRRTETPTGRREGGSAGDPRKTRQSLVMADTEGPPRLRGADRKADGFGTFYAAHETFE